MITQIVPVTLMNLRNIRQRPGNSAVILVGMICSVAVIVSIAAMIVGLNRMVELTGHRDRAIIVSRGSGGEGASTLPRGSEATILSAPAIKRTADGKPIAAIEVVSTTVLQKKSDGHDRFIPVRGTNARGLALRTEIKLAQGRMFTPGVRELIAGQTAADTFSGLQIDDEIKLRGTVWKVVGTFASNGDAHESELLGDAETLLSAVRQNGWSSILVQLDAPDRLADLNSFLSADPTLQIDVKRKSDFFLEMGKAEMAFLLIITTSVGTILGLGAFAGALNTMYSTVRARALEIATLRAIGFGASPVVASVLAESMLLAGCGAAIGAAIAWLGFDGHRQTFGFVYASVVSPGLVLTAIAVALLVGLLGGLIPAIRAARLPVAAALRAK